MLSALKGSWIFKAVIVYNSDLLEEFTLSVLFEESINLDIASRRTILAQYSFNYSEVRLHRNPPFPLGLPNSLFCCFSFQICRREQCVCVLLFYDGITTKQAERGVRRADECRGCTGKESTIEL